MPLEAALLLQARTGSTRLPGKALAPIGGRSVVWHCLERLVASGVGPVVLATTTSQDDDLLVAEARNLHVWTVRGDSLDVLGRLARAARALGSTFVIRATGDNPAVDIDAPRRAIAALRESGADYCCEAGLPVGAAVEAMKTSVLLDAHALASSPSDREHVTPFIRRERSRYRVIEPAAPPRLRRPDLRLSIDTREDLAFVRAAASRLGTSLSRASLADIIAAADQVSADQVSAEESVA